MHDLCVRLIASRIDRNSLFGKATASLFGRGKAKWELFDPPPLPERSSPENAPEYTMHDTDYQHDPFLPLRPISQPKTSDEEYVAKIAKSLQWWDRWRWLAVLFHLAILGAIIWFGFSAVALVQNLQNMWGNQLPEEVVLIGIILGLKVGFSFHFSLMGVINALAGFRSERLLVQYFNKL